MFWNNFSFKKLTEKGLINMNKEFQLSSAQKVLIGILLLGVIGSILLMFNSVRNIIILIVEKAMLGRPLNKPYKWHSLLRMVSIFGIFSCFSLIALVLFVQKIFLFVKKYVNIVKTLFVLSGTVLAVASSTQQIGLIMNGVGDVKGLAVRWLFAIALFTLAGLSVLVFKYHFLEKTYDKLLSNSKIVQVLFMVFAMLCGGRYVGSFYDNAYLYGQYLRDFHRWWFHLLYAYEKVSEPFPFTPPQWILSVALFIPVTVFYAYLSMALVDVFKSVFYSLTSSERRFLIIGSAAAVLYIVVLYNLSNLYYAPVLKDTTNILGADALYQLDSGPRIKNLQYTNILGKNQNGGFSHPALEVFTLPFGLIAEIISVKPRYYGITNGILQLLMLLFSALLMSRMAARERKSQIPFLVFTCTTFPFLVLSTGIESYTFATFWLVLALYESHYGRNSILWASGSVGAVITNGLAFFTAIRTKRTAIKDLFLQGAAFLLILCCLQGISAVLSVNFRTNYHATDISMFEKFKHFSVFAKSTLFASGPKFINLDSTMPRVVQEDVTAVSVVGVIILALVIIGFVLNYKKRLAVFAFLWVLTSYIGIGVVGWTVKQNQVVLFDIYFSWAYVTLMYMAIDKLFGERKKKEKAATLLVLAALCLVVNGKAVIEILRFGIEFYPVR